MVADAVGVPLENVHVVSSQDTDVTPYGTGAYASRQTYIGGFSIIQTATALRERILRIAHDQTRMPVSNLDLVDGNIVRKSDGRVLKTLGDLATEALYSLTDSQHITAETTAQIKSNAYSFGCSFAEVEVDIPMCKVKLLKHGERPRLRDPHQSRPGGGPGPRRYVHGHRLRPFRGTEIR